MAQLVLALDLPRKDAALDMARRVRGRVPWCKVGMELFTLAGPSMLAELKDMGFKVFLDLKFYDIPHTVGRAVAACARMGVDLLTLHCQGGGRMCREAALAASTTEDAVTRPMLFGVTVLTSFAAGEMPGIGLAPGEFALELAGQAQAWGLTGVVCSGEEVASIKRAAPGLACLCPGIRLADAASDDQRRVMTPGRAVALGADYLVVGRPILQAEDPVAACERILQEMQTDIPQR